MEERRNRRLWNKNLKQLNEKGWYTLEGKTFMAMDYIREKVRNNLNNPEVKEKFLAKVKSSKIFVSDEADRDNAIELLKSQGLNPTVNKFILLNK